MKIIIIKYWKAKPSIQPYNFFQTNKMIVIQARFINMKLFLLSLCVVFMMRSGNLFAQVDDGPDAENNLFTISAPVSLDFRTDEADESLVEIKKEKKRKRNHYYGVKTKKGFTRKGFSKNITLELFYFLKEPVEIDPYVRDVYWFDYKRREILKGQNYDPERGALLHGPYKKVLGNQLLDSGVYYFGMKHGTWLFHDKNDVLIDKEKYYKGWPRESLVKYYDKDRLKMKEIIPVEFGEKEGNYFYFFENGRVAVRGEFRWDRKVGDWMEYYETGRRKKIVRYSKDPFGEEKPFVLREWDVKGKEVYDYFKARR